MRAFGISRRRGWSFDGRALFQKRQIGIGLYAPMCAYIDKSVGHHVKRRMKQDRNIRRKRGEEEPRVGLTIAGIRPDDIPP